MPDLVTTVVSQIEELYPLQACAYRHRFRLQTDLCMPYGPLGSGFATHKDYYYYPLLAGERPRI